MNRLYAVESTHTTTGAMADHRRPLRPSEITSFTLALAQELGTEIGPDQVPRPPLAEADVRWLRAVGDDLRGHQGAGIVIAGLQQPPVVHALAHAINHTLRF
jgi:hypothetical protein